MAAIKIYELDYEGFLNDLEAGEIGGVLGGNSYQSNDADVDIDQSNRMNGGGGGGGEHDDEEDDDDDVQINDADVFISQSNR